MSETVITKTPLSIEVMNVTKVFPEQFKELKEVLSINAKTAIEQVEKENNVHFIGSVNFYYGGDFENGYGLNSINWRGTEKITEKAHIKVERKVPDGEKAFCKEERRGYTNYNLYFPISPDKESILRIGLAVLVWRPVGIEEDIAKKTISYIMSECEDSFMAHLYTARDAILKTYDKGNFTRKKAYALADSLGIRDHVPMESALDDLYIHKKLRIRTKYDGLNPPSSSPYGTFYLI